MAVSDTYNDNVFLNCPFDKRYAPLMHGLLFTIYHCGFYPKCALEEDDGTQLRLNKINLLIEDCKYGIHDISRTELDEKTKLPRFNMPFELGLFFACKEFGSKTHKKKKALILDKVAYRYQKFISDLNGIDPRAHNNKVNTIITICRNWLVINSKRKTIPGDKIIIANFKSFKKDLPKLAKEAGLNKVGLKFNDLCYFMEEWLKFKLEN